MVRVLDRCELHGADVVRHLRQPVLRGLRRAVDDRILRQRVLNRAVKRFRDGVLAVVVVDLDRVVRLQLREVVRTGSSRCPFASTPRLVERGEQLVAYAVWFSRACGGRRRGTSRASSCASSGRAPVLVLAVHERRRMEGMSGSPLERRAPSYAAIEFAMFSDWSCMTTVEQVVAVGEAVASRLVDEDAEFSHCSPG